MTDYSSYQHLLIEKADGIITLTMNRPESLKLHQLSAPQ